ncbi:unnamed protein product [Brassica oleracea var. botrytis]
MMVLMRAGANSFFIAENVVKVKKSAKSSVISHQSRTYVVITCVGQEECKVIFCISVTGNAYVLTLVVL